MICRQVPLEVLSPSARDLGEPACSLPEKSKIDAVLHLVRVLQSTNRARCPVPNVSSTESETLPWARSHWKCVKHSLEQLHLTIKVTGRVYVLQRNHAKPFIAVASSLAGQVLRENLEQGGVPRTFSEILESVSQDFRNGG